MLLKGLNHRERVIVDLFEDDYTKEEVQVTVASQRDPVSALTYVWNYEVGGDRTHGTWSYDEHFTPGAKGFVDRSKEFLQYIIDEGLVPAQEES
ncbi:unnamed protein product [Chrysoparadoxa australica]